MTLQGAFRNLSYHPALVAMHSLIIGGLLFVCNRLTFGDNSSPSNFEIIAQARSEVAQYLWQISDAVNVTTAKCLPNIVLAPRPTQLETDTFISAIPDTQNGGVFNDDGVCQPPHFITMSMIISMQMCTTSF